MKTYKVWIHIEEHDDETDDYNDFDLPNKLFECETPEEANAYVEEVLALLEKEFSK